MSSGNFEPRRHEGHEELGSRVEEIARTVLDAAVKVHKALGPGLLETVYEQCLSHELARRGLSVQRQVRLPIAYEDMVIDAGLRLDMLVEEVVVVEVKAIDALARVHEAQLLTYLKLSGRRLGFLIKFNVDLLKHGVKRIVH